MGSGIGSGIGSAGVMPHRAGGSSPLDCTALFAHLRDRSSGPFSAVGRLLLG